MRLGTTLMEDSSKIILLSKLEIPFGTMSKLEVEIYDGDNLHWKAYEGTYLLKVNSINSKKINDTLILRFTDETETLANDCFSLYKLIYKKSGSPISDAQLNKMEKKYVGKKFTVMAYETGQFTGSPEKYFDYKPIVPGIPHVFATHRFLFEHSLVIVSNLKK
ncbi:MAG: hypothetical protein ABIN67_06875 [Ferruginibacter sp.]